MNILKKNWKQENLKKIRDMAEEKLNLKNCTKQQILDVIKAARERKLAWEERVQEDMRRRQDLRHKAQESQYSKEKNDILTKFQ